MTDLALNLSVFWAKRSETRTGKPAYHPLLCHLLDVAAVVDALWSEVLPAELRRRIADTFGIDEPAAGRWLSFWGALHDLGKLSPAFQLRPPDETVAERLRAAGLSWQPQRADGVPHGVVTALALEELLPLFGLSREVSLRVASLLGGHHGVFPRSAELNDLRDRPAAVGGRRWAEARSVLARALALALDLPTERPPLRLDNATAMVVAGLVSVADWIGSVEKRFPYLFHDSGTVGRVDGRQYLSEARWRARSALEKLGWTAWPSATDVRSFRQLFPAIQQPNPLQCAAMALADRLEGPALVVVEAPTGEGKTEAAMYLADRRASRVGRTGCYFALPTQATSDQMFGRVRDFLLARYPESTVNLQLLHGHASLSAEFALLRLAADRLLAPTGVEGENGYDGAQPAVVAAEWFTHRKRGLLAPFGVGTVDQALLAALQTRHVFVRLFGLAGKTVIFDEVHAYDSYMTQLLDRLLEWLAALGSSVVLLSATLPGSRRRQLAEAYLRGLGQPPHEPRAEARYPRLTWVGTSGAGACPLETSPRATKEVDIRWVDGSLPAESRPFDLGVRLREALADGGCAAVVCNTVDRAQQVYLALKPFFPGLADDGEPELDLLHARYLFEDRERREKRSLLRFGREGARVSVGESDVREVLRPRRAVLVSTQIIEQSLDLDFDLMVTDPAPVDLVLQRLGRLHRHPRPRPRGLERPALWISAPQVDGEGVPAFGGGTERVYDRHILLRSWLALKDVPLLRVPGQVEELVEAVYGDRACPPELSGSLRRLWDETLARQAADRGDYRYRARQLSVLPPSYPLDELLEDFNRRLEEDNPEIAPSLQALTRLSDPSVQVVCLRHEDPLPFDVGAKPTLEQAASLLRRSVHVSHGAVVHALLREPPPTTWSGCPLLRHHRLIYLKDGRSRQFGDYRLCLDEELGLSIIDVSREVS